jgi:hypothetical protein
MPATTELAGRGIAPDLAIDRQTTLVAMSVPVGARCVGFVEFTSD